MLKELKQHGKRKSRAKPAPKKRMDKLDTVFSCPSVIMEQALSAASLTEPIEIYSEWIDECERVNNLEEEEEDVDQDEGYVPRKRVSTAEWDD
ncbi:Transcription elongation factor 1-like protein [Hibiscus syriacus]|uniref:Transcription elongation factor 1-like protein n=1 Tax=Hibiscus syriacus TaxID=106335 RepID=A0A6A3BDS0_HIBSY|nr:Transcription elongation factor 1-like protein [Hibiscus syriacus]